MYKFQSRNGLIWTDELHDTETTYSTFQSRNGLIWTVFKHIYDYRCE